MKLCPVCNINKSKTEFYKNRTMPDQLTLYCSTCIKFKYTINRTEVQNRIRIKRAKDPIDFLLVGAKQRAKKQNVPFNIISSDIAKPTHCPVLGIKLNYEGTGRGYGAKDDAASLDRVRNELGYVPGNTFIVSWRANRAKCFLSPEELQLMAKYYAKFINVAKK